MLTWWYIIPFLPIHICGWLPSIGVIGSSISLNQSFFFLEIYLILFQFFYMNTITFFAWRLFSGMVIFFFIWTMGSCILHCCKVFIVHHLSQFISKMENFHYIWIAHFTQKYDLAICFLLFYFCLTYIKCTSRWLQPSWYNI